MLQDARSSRLGASEAKAVRHEDHLSQRRCSISPGREFRGCAGLHARNREALCCCAKGTSTQHSTQLESSLFPFLPCHAATASAFTAWQTCRALLPAAAPSEKLCAKIFCMPSCRLPSWVRRQRLQDKVAAAAKSPLPALPGTALWTSLRSAAAPDQRFCRQSAMPPHSGSILAQESLHPALQTGSTRFRPHSCSLPGSPVCQVPHISRSGVSSRIA